MAKHAVRMINALREEAGTRKVSEAEILEKVEKMADPDTDPGEWITQYDIVEAGDALELVDTGAAGKCGSECRTIARICETISEDLDLTDLSAMLYKGRKRGDVSKWMCHESTSVCSKQPAKLPKDRVPGEAHQPLSEDELRTARMLRNMKANGMSGTLYNRETMLQELDDLKDAYGEDEDFNKLLQETEESLRTGPEAKPPAQAAASQPNSPALPQPLTTAAEAVSAGVKRVRQEVERAVVKAQSLWSWAKGRALALYQRAREPEL